MENINAIERLLAQVASINRHYEEIAKISGENFNVFNVLGLTSEEMSHSKFIAMLLNPKGEHGMDSLFLELFIETINIDKCNEYNFADAIVQTEKPITDGRLDILITAKNRNIIIENKIYAGDQNQQLLCYHNYDKDAVLLYLTLDGRNPSEKSAGGLKKDEDYYCISYKEHILNWLESCVKETANSPFLRETISQYILLIKQLTGQARSKQMNNEVLNIITINKENLMAFLVVENIKRREIFEYVLGNTIIPALKKVSECNGLLFEVTDEQNDMLKEEYGFRFTKQPEWRNFYIWFAFGNNLNDLICDIFNKETKKFLGDWESCSMGEYKNWHWNNTEMLTKLCCQTDDVIREIGNRIKELIPEVENLIQKR